MKSNSTKKAKNLNNKNEKLVPVSHKKWRYSLLTILLFIFLAQLFWGLLINSAKIYSLRTKISKLEKINKTAVKKNQYLREELEKYTSNSGVEALARNRLQFSKDDETLIIIKNTKQGNEEF